MNKHFHDNNTAELEHLAQTLDNRIKQFHVELSLINQEYERKLNELLECQRVRNKALSIFTGTWHT